MDSKTCFLKTEGSNIKTTKKLSLVDKREYGEAGREIEKQKQKI